MSVTLPTLPYAYNALEPYIGQKTVEIHHDKHHAKYVANTNALIAGTDLENADLVTIIRGNENQQLCDCIFYKLNFLIFL